MISQLLSSGAASFDVGNALETGSKVINWAFDLVIANPVLTAVFCLGTLVPAGIAAFNHFKRAAS